MTEAVTQARAPKHVRSRLVPDDLVSPNGLATHLGMTRQNVARLTAEAVLVQRSDGCYDQTANRLRYIKHLRTSRPHSPRTEADAAHVAAKTEMLQLKLAEKRGQLCLQSDVDELIHKIVGITLTGLSDLAARCAPPGDLATRRRIEDCVYQVRRELAAIGNEMADKNGEPPFDQQG